MATSRTLGILLAAGAGRRAGGPKALRLGTDGVPWVARSVQVLLDGGCEHVLVVLGAGALEVEPLVRDRDDVSTTWCARWDEGMGASLRCGLGWALEAAGDEDGIDADAALIHLVDLPDVDDGVIARVLDRARGRDALARATYDGRPGHPVLLGADHWGEVLDSARGDRGARDVLARRDVRAVECGDLATGLDVDGPPD